MSCYASKQLCQTRIQVLEDRAFAFFGVVPVLLSQYFFILPQEVSLRSSSTLTSGHAHNPTYRTRVRFFHASAVDQVLQVGRENKKLLRLWKASRARLLEAERTGWSGEGDQTPALMSNSGKIRTSQEEIEKPAPGRRSSTRARRSTKKGAPPTKAGREKREGVLAPPLDVVAQGSSLQ